MNLSKLWGIVKDGKPDTKLMEEREEEQKSLLTNVKEESERADLKHNNQKPRS